MASANIKELTDANFESEVLNSEVPTLVDFWAVWCGPCKQIAPTVDALADEYKGRVKVAKMDVDHHQLVPQQYGVRSIPTLLIFKGGKVVGQLVGAMPRSKLEAELQKHLDPPHLGLESRQRESPTIGLARAYPIGMHDHGERIETTFSPGRFAS